MFNFLFQSNLGELIAPIQSAEQQLLIAIQNRKTEKVHQLLEVQRVPATSKNPNGVSALHIACQIGWNDLVKRLLELGADLLSVDNAGNSPLHYAARGGKMDTVRLLVDLGMKVDVRNSLQQTAYDLATNHVVRQYLLPLQLKAEALSGVPTQCDYPNAPYMSHVQSQPPPPSPALEALMQAHSGQALPLPSQYSTPFVPSTIADIPVDSKKRTISHLRVNTSECRWK
jgi:hypothetical protein